MLALGTTLTLLLVVGLPLGLSVLSPGESDACGAGTGDLSAAVLSALGRSIQSRSDGVDTGASASNVETPIIHPARDETAVWPAPRETVSDGSDADDVSRRLVASETARLL